MERKKEAAKRQVKDKVKRGRKGRRKNVCGQPDEAGRWKRLYILARCVLAARPK